MKKQFITKKLLEENRKKTEKAIIENFAKTFNKIKRLNEDGVSEYDYRGIDDANAPWNQEDDPYMEDQVEEVTELAAIGGYKNPLTLDSAKRLGIDGVTEMGRNFRGTLAGYIDASGLSQQQKQQFIDYLRSVGEEEVGVYRDGGDEFYIDLDNPEIQQKFLSLNVNPNELEGDYPKIKGPEPDFDRSDYDRDHPDVRAKEWGGMDI